MQKGFKDLAIIGVSLRSRCIKEKLENQDYLYSVCQISERIEKIQIINSIKNIIYAPEEPDRIINYISDQNIKYITITVTENGYKYNPETSSLLKDKDLKNDLKDLVLGEDDKENNENSDGKNPQSEDEQENNKLETSQAGLDAEYDFDNQKNMSYYDANRELEKVFGIGNKVADCILLFSLDKLEAFPLDRLMLLLFQKYYSKKFEPSSKTITGALPPNSR